MGYSIPGRYAGYFKGNVHVTGTVTAQTVTVVSDGRYKKNVNNIGGIKGLNKLVRLEPVEYDMTDISTYNIANDTASSDTVNISKHSIVKAAPAKNTEDSRRHFGLIAQDVQELYPELVYSDDNGYLSIDYIGLIPLLIQSVQELNTEIATLKIQNENNGKKNSKQASGTVQVESDMITETVLYQNSPNPFSENTEIAYTLPESVQTAAIYLYDMNGVQLDSYILSKRGNSTLTISGGQLEAGMYLYTLIADGKVVDTKRMILTK